MTRKSPSIAPARMTMNLSDLLEACSGKDGIWITGHAYPDGDCIGAALSLAMAMEKAGVPVKVSLKDIPDNMRYLPAAEHVVEEVPEAPEVLVIVDSGDPERIGHMAPCLGKAGTVVNIDHHASNSLFGDLVQVVKDASSTCEIIYNMIEASHPELMDAKIAEALYTGIIYDTGCFKHDNTSPATMAAAGRLIGYGIDFSWMIDNMYYSRSLKDAQAFGRAFNRLYTALAGQVAVAAIEAADSRELGITKGNTEGIVQKMNEIKECSASLFLYETEAGVFKASMRSKGALDVCRVAMAFGGGGHVKAAGCSLSGTLEETTRAILEEMGKQLV